MSEKVALKRINVFVDASLYADAKQAAKQHGMFLGAWIERALKAQIARDLPAAAEQKRATR